ncbi:MAG: SDR family oxidoreductase [Rhizobiales bacterium]|nr:SDR family oxidoreductase [Hyphomicrobiales bacterium]
MRFDGEVALITGAGSGVGLAAARRFAAEGCRVVATVLNGAQLPVLAGAPFAERLILDVRREEDWTRVVAAVEAKFGAVDILFNNAGVTIRGDVAATDRATWDEALLANLTSVYLGCRAVLPGMRRRRRGTVVNNASINGIRGNTGLVAYSAAKGGVVAMTRSLALDHAAEGIRVNCLCPAAIDTTMTRDYLDTVSDRGAVEAAIVAKHPLGRIATADEVAAVAVFLASADAGFITGAAIPVDGGRSAR